jgi:hypothetical protein
MRIAKVILTCILIASLSGCGAIFKGSSQDISIQSAPAGATVTGSPGFGTLTTPTTVKLSRNSNYEMSFSKEGYNSTSVGIRKSADGGIIVLDVLFTGLIGVVIDAATGSWNNLKPETVNAVLEKEETGMLGPDKIEITVSSCSAGAGVNIESTEPVTVEVRQQ